MSRAACSASVASVACSEPTCLCASPLRLRMKTSQSGICGVAMMISLLGGLQGRPLPALLGIGQCGVAHPGAFLMRLVPRRQPITVTGAVAGQHRIELAPVDRAVFPVAGFVLLHAGIRNRKSEELRLRHGGVDEFLPQLVVGEALDLPLGRSVAVLAG